MSMNYKTADIVVGYGIRERNIHSLFCVGFVKKSGVRSMSKMMTKLVPMLVSIAASVSFGAVGDRVAVLSPEPPIEDKFCSMGLAFDGSSLYFNRCSDPNIYAISTQNGSLQESKSLLEPDPLHPRIPEWPAAMAYDAKRKGLWIGTQTGTGGSRPSTCIGVTNMPIYFWDFVNDSVTIKFTISPSFFDRCLLEGLEYRENDLLLDDDDELWVSDERSRTVCVFMPDVNGVFMLVRSFDAAAVDARLADTTGLAIGGDKLYLSTGCTFPGMCGDVFRATHDMVSLIPFDQFVTASDTLDNLWQSDMACDDMTFSSIGKTVMWIRTSPQNDPANDLITAYEIEPGGCGQGDAVGACCVSTTVSCTNEVSQETCQAMQGSWMQGLTCPDVSGCEAHEIILLDRTGSMKINVRQATGNTRCFDALETAKSDVDNFFRTHSVGSSLAVWTFTRDPVTSTVTHIDLTGGFVSDAATARTALSNALDGVACSGFTPVAETMCDAVDALTAAFPNAVDKARILAVSSDGGENSSSMNCAGPDSLNGSTCDGTDPFDPTSWQKLACGKIVGNAIAQVRFWGSFGGASAASSSSTDSETGALRPASVPDTSFFAALANATGGSIVMLNDSPPPVTGPSVFGVVGACCFSDGTCREAITQAECAVLGGTHLGEASICADAMGACCISGSGCLENTTAAECAAQGGVFQGGCSTCALSGCGPVIPTVSTWGMGVLTLLVLIAGTTILRRANILER